MSQTTTSPGPLTTGRSAPGGAPAAATLAYAAACYLLFLGVLAYAVGFFVGVGVPKGIDDGPDVPVPVAVGVDLLLLSLFAVQHSVMARPWFKRHWTRLVPVPVERATYVLAANLVLLLLFWLWQPIGAVVWSTSGPAAAAVWALHGAGWVFAIGSTFLVSHSDLFGLRQAWHRARRLVYRAPAFTERGPYRRVRHPLMVGFIVVFWSAPTMTVGHLLFAVAATAYILVGIAFEEHDLERSLGDDYLDYRARVPALVPRRSPRHPAQGSRGTADGSPEQES